MRSNRIINSYDNLGNIVDLDKAIYVQIELLGGHANTEDASMLVSKNVLENVINFSWYMGSN